jgi:Fic family protein
VWGFLSWYSSRASIDPLIKTGLAHLWFVTIHSFDDGNGRIARVLTDMQLARSDGSVRRFYSMSEQVFAAGLKLKFTKIGSQGKPLVADFKGQWRYCL